MRSSRPPRSGSPPAALPALLRASHFFGLALGSALGKLRDSGVTAARMFERVEEERWPVPSVPEAASTVPRAVRARRPNHVWMVDLTDVKGLFGLVTFKVGVVFNVFSRMPLLAMVFSKEPSAVETARFVSRAARLCGLHRSSSRIWLTASRAGSFAESSGGSG